MRTLSQLALDPAVPWGIGQSTPDSPCLPLDVSPPLTLTHMRALRWRSDPAVSWDVGRCCWATPFEHAKPGEPHAAPGGSSAGLYHLVMAMPLAGPFG